MKVSRRYHWVALLGLPLLPSVSTAEEPENIATLEGHSGALSSVAFTPSSGALVSSAWDQSLRHWNMKTGEQIIVIPDKGDVFPCMAYTPDGGAFAVGGVRSSRMTLYKLTVTAQGSTLKEIRSFERHKTTSAFMNAPQVRGVTFSKDGKLAASGGDGRCLVFETGSGKTVARLGGDGDLTFSVALSPDGRTLAVAGPGRVRLWHVKSGKGLFDLRGHKKSARAVAFGPDGKVLVSAGDDGAIKVWEAATGKVLVSLEDHGGAVRCIAFSPDGKILASGSADRAIKLWDTRGWKKVATLEGHKGAVVTLAYSRDGKYLASGSEDKTIKVWSVAGAKE